MKRMQVEGGRTARSIRLAAVTALALAAANPVPAQEARLPAAPIAAHLVDPQDLHAATYAGRSMWVEHLATDSFEMRVSLWLLLGEPVQRYEVRTPRLQRLVFEADAGYANRVEIHRTGGGEDQISANFGAGVVDVYVSQDVLDRIAIYGFTFSIGTYGLDPLPDEFYAGAGDPRRWAISAGNRVHVHSLNTGVLARPGSWGWDLPGSPGWGEFLSPFDIPLAAGEYEVPEDRRMPAEDAREAFRRMLYRHHVQQQDLFVNGWFEVQNLRVSATDLLSFLHEQRRDVYARIMERESASPEDADAMQRMAGVHAAYAGAIDAQGTIRPSAPLDRLVAATDRAIAAHGAALSEDVRRKWTNVRRRYADAPFEHRLAGFRPALSGLTDDTFGTVVTDRMRRQAAALREDADGRAGPRVLRQVRAVERLVNLTPKPRPPSSLLLLIDTSGSMDGEIGNGNGEIKIEAARSAAIAALEQAAAGGRMEAAVLAFSGDCGDPVPRYLDFTDDIAELTAFINRLQAGGGTPMAPALQFANRFMQDRRDPQSQAQMIVLLADGDNDCGDVGQALAELHAAGIVFRHETVGFGIEPGSQAAQDLRHVAVESGGAYHHAASAAQLAELFLEVVDPFTVMDLFGTISPGPVAGAAPSPGSGSAQSRGATEGERSGVTSLLGMFGSASDATPSPEPPSSGGDEAEGVTSLLGMFAQAAAQEGSAGALAIDTGQGGKWGWAADYPAMRDAEQRALAECGTGCRIVMRFESGCAAYAADQAQGSTAAGWASGLGTGSGARQAALSACAERRGADCIVRVWACARSGE